MVTHRCDVVRTSGPFGREVTVVRIAETAASPGAAPLVLVTGPVGIGRSAVLAAVRDRLAARGIATLMLRVARNERDRSYSLAARLSAELGALYPGGNGGRTASAVTGPASRPDVCRQLAGELRSAMTTGHRLVVLVDDLQWIDPDSRNLLLSMVRPLAGSPVTFVCAHSSPGADPGSGRTALHHLRAAGLAEVVPLRPLHASDVNALVAHELQAKPSVSLAAYLRRSCRGVPSAVLAAVAGHRRSGSLRVFDRHAYLASPDRPPELPADHPLVEHLRQFGGLGWPVAKALAVLYPLGGSATGLIAEAVGTGEDEVRDALSVLCAEGVLRHGPEPGHWRFRLPLVASALTTWLGQYERRRLAQLAVTAIWAGDAAADGRYLAEQLATAGRFVDSRRAADELLLMGADTMLDNGYFAEGWLRAAANLITEPGRRAQALLLHAATCCIHLRFPEALDSAWAVLSGHPDLVAPEALLELEIMYIVSLAGTFDAAALAGIADDGWRSLPGGEGHRIVARSATLCHLDRWREAGEHLKSTRGTWSVDNDAVSALGLLFSECIAAFLGRMAAFDQAVADPTRWPLWEKGSRHRYERLAELTRTLMAFGELDRADQLLATYELSSGYRPVPDQIVANSLAGHWDQALDLARMGLATGSSLGDLPSHTMMCRETSVILAARGRLTHARAAIDRARTEQPVLLHLLAVPESELEHALGATERARRVIADALSLADARGLVVGTDELWLRMAEWELAGGDPAAARRCADEATRVAGLIGTGRAQLCRLLATAVAHRDPAAAAEAVRLARRRAQPYEQADTMAAVVRHGLADVSLLFEAYALYGELDALLPRVRLRNLMRERNIAVPGRSATIAENERLLATLVTEGLTNRELAVVLGCSEKSVESRLSRLFKRTGYQSRVELASAMLTGEYLA
ncbi:helix-turn-helix domain-containing protein [Streptomyces sp. HC44]|uniref:Helix-turn-helix domain-containing protein n=1 Tax=Streptomyces scabichelini TaxID=2711217 RepID=A0A6G4VEH9_9ACTN|nr:helix-turn-helix domain-containing protein [Streptomyces scabichelini]